ncbi:hypothetical protein [Streptomyces cylindrosporus]|uniref:Uncharacterized protein n=1 Tax=Streptomyces cylindrosporus TaxID=2927583 RepID=A0ABS9Y4C6_9ACTN|nr:hypothetical protein [Streptomyces cylindrosporus]MCI3272049.1 hypothetical protein [Streptomyces cylindrosporus]
MPVVPVGTARRRGRTALLIAGAAVLGVVAGTCTGYLVQADREPTKLPSLSQPVLAQAGGDGPEPLSAAQDRRVKTDGDLRKLLLKKPAGAKDADYLMGDDGWMDLAAYAETYDHPQSVFGDLVSEEFRRAAVTGWTVGSTYGVEIRLVQYRQQERLEASDTVDDQQYWRQSENGARSWPIPGTGKGMVYVDSRPETKAGYLPQYNAEAAAWRGDIALEIFVWDSKPVPQKKIMDLAKRQMERL